MKRQQKWTKPPGWHPVTAISCLAAFLFALAAATIPQLHEALHSEAPQSQHECAITVVESGIDTGPAPVRTPAPQSAALSTVVSALHPIWLPAQFLSVCAFEHAPPALS